MNLRSFKVLIGSFIVGVLISTSFMVAIASQTYSPYKPYGPILGYSYKNQSMVSNTPRLYGATTVCNQASGNVPSGYMAAKAYLYNNQGVAVDQTDWYFNDGPAWSIGPCTIHSGFSPGAYCSRGVSAAYNGNGYTSEYTYWSPYINY